MFDLKAAAAHPVLAGSPLRRRGVAILFVLLMAGLLGTALTVFALVMEDWNREALGIFGRSLLTATLLSAVPALLLGWLDRRERESPGLLLVAFLWGGLIAAGLAMALNDGLAGLLRSSFGLGAGLPGTKAEGEALVSALLAAPLVEEALKALGIVFLFWALQGEYDNLRDGFVYGAAVGLGFTWMETSLYVVGTWLEDGPRAWAMQMGWRYALFGLAGHALYSGLFGACLGLSRQTGRPWLRQLAPFAGLALALLAHSLDNLWSIYLGSLNLALHWSLPVFWLAASGWQLVFMAPFVLLVLWLLWRGGLSERAVIREELAGEHEALVSAADQAAIAADGLFKTRRVDPVRHRLSARLVNAQNELAFRRRWVRRQGQDPEWDPLVRVWRDEIWRLRGELARAAAAGREQGAEMEAAAPSEPAP